MPSAPVGSPTSGAQAAIDRTQPMPPDCASTLDRRIRVNRRPSASLSDASQRPLPSCDHATEAASTTEPSSSQVRTARRGCTIGDTSDRERMASMGTCTTVRASPDPVSNASTPPSIDAATPSS